MMLAVAMLAASPALQIEKRIKESKKNQNSKVKIKQGTTPTYEYRPRQAGGFSIGETRTSIVKARILIQFLKRSERRAYPRYVSGSRKYPIAGITMVHSASAGRRKMDSLAGHSTATWVRAKA
jgi:hypothetical protein